MQTVLKGTIGFIATTITLSLLAGGAAAGESADDDVIEVRARLVSDPAEVNRDLAKRAHAAAVEDAIQALLADNKVELDIRVIGRTSGVTSGYAAAGR